MVRDSADDCDSKEICSDAVCSGWGEYVDCEQGHRVAGRCVDCANSTDRGDGEVCRDAACAACLKDERGRGERLRRRAGEICAEGL